MLENLLANQSLARILFQQRHHEFCRGVRDVSRSEILHDILRLHPITRSDPHPWPPGGDTPTSRLRRDVIPYFCGGIILCREDHAQDQNTHTHTHTHTYTHTQVQKRDTQLIRFHSINGDTRVQTSRPCADLGFESNGEVAVLIFVEGRVAAPEHDTRST